MGWVLVGWFKSWDLTDELVINRLFVAAAKVDLVLKASIHQIGSTDQHPISIGTECV